MKCHRIWQQSFWIPMTKCQMFDRKTNPHKVHTHTHTQARQNIVASFKSLFFRGLTYLRTHTHTDSQLRPGANTHKRYKPCTHTHTTTHTHNLHLDSPAYTQRETRWMNAYLPFALQPQIGATLANPEGTPLATLATCLLPPATSTCHMAPGTSDLPLPLQPTADG